MHRQLYFLTQRLCFLTQTFFSAATVLTSPLASPSSDKPRGEPVQKRDRFLPPMLSSGRPLLTAHPVPGRFHEWSQLLPHYTRVTHFGGDLHTQGIHSFIHPLDKYLLSPAMCQAMHQGLFCDDEQDGPKSSWNFHGGDTSMGQHWTCPGHRARIETQDCLTSKLLLSVFILYREQIDAQQMGEGLGGWAKWMKGIKM